MVNEEETRRAVAYLEQKLYEMHGYELPEELKCAVNNLRRCLYDKQEKNRCNIDIPTALPENDVSAHCQASRVYNYMWRQSDGGDFLIMWDNDLLRWVVHHIDSDSYPHTKTLMPTYSTLDRAQSVLDAVETLLHAIEY